MRRIAIIFNQKSGVSDKLTEIKEYYAKLPEDEYFVETTIIDDGNEIHDVARTYARGEWDVIVAAGGDATIATDAATAIQPIASDRLLVIVCDRLFERVIGDACGGPAEGRFIARLRGGDRGPEPTLVDRFDASPRTSVSVYRP